MLLMGIPSLSELIIIFGVVFLLFGGKKLPELGGAIGESIKNFKKGIKDDETATPPVDPNRRLTEAQPGQPQAVHPGEQPAATTTTTSTTNPTTPKDG
jgi:sec-independent protein translocase protein TatA